MGKILTPGHPFIMRGNWMKGRHLSEETKKKMSQTQLKRKELLGYMNSPEARRKISESLTGRKLSLAHRQAISRGLKGKIQLQATREKRSQALSGEKNPQWGKRGKDSPGWKGGTTILAEHIRRIFDYRQWRSDVFTKDDFTCQDCRRRGGKLRAHHIEPFIFILELNDITTVEQAQSCDELWNINNGVTLCEKCHKDRHKKNEQNFNSTNKVEHSNYQ